MIRFDRGAGTRRHRLQYLTMPHSVKPPNSSIEARSPLVQRCAAPHRITANNMGLRSLWRVQDTGPEPARISQNTGSMM